MIYPPAGPAAPAQESRPGLLIFRRGKSCLFRLQPATLHRLLLRTPLYTLLLQLPPGHPTPAPQLLGACSISPRHAGFPRGEHRGSRHRFL